MGKCLECKRLEAVQQGILRRLAVWGITEEKGDLITQLIDWKRERDGLEQALHQLQARMVEHDTG